MRRQTYGNAVVVLLADALSLGLALLEWVLVLELGTHVVEVECKCAVVLGGKSGSGWLQKVVQVVWRGRGYVGERVAQRCRRA